VTPNTTARARSSQVAIRRASAPDATKTLALDALRRVVRALRLAASDAERVSGLTSAQLFVLARVASLPGQSLSELAQHTMTDRTSVARDLRALATGLTQLADAMGIRSEPAVMLFEEPPRDIAAGRASPKRALEKRHG
jgi:hypothetical protein